MVLTRMYILWIWGEEFYKYSLSLLVPGLSSNHRCLLIFYLADLSNINNVVSKSPATIVWECKSLYKLLRTCLMYLSAPILGAYIFMITDSCCCIDPFTMM